MKTKYLVICTYRTGSTLLCDLIRRRYGFTNYNEYLSLIDNTKSLFSLESGRLTDLQLFTTEIKTRIDVLTQSNNWVTKLPIVNASYLNLEFIKQCKADLNTEIIFLYRKDIAAQLLSALNATHRGNMLGRPSNTFTQHTYIPHYDKIELSEKSIHEITLNLSRRLVLWRMIYDLHGHGCKLLSYEDNILNFNLESIGIENNMSDYIKTPHNIPVSSDIWNKCVDFINQYKYTVDI